jgi:hypothetical protein
MGGILQQKFSFLCYDTDGVENDGSNDSIVACIRCSGNVFTEPLPRSDMGLHIQTCRLMGGIYELNL